MAFTQARSLISGLENSLCCPFLNKQGQLHAVLQNSGEIIRISDNGQDVTVLYNTGGQPSGAMFDKHGVLYVTDLAHAAVLVMGENGEQEIIVSTYEDKPLKGPHSIACTSNGSVFFSDSGAFGETGLHNPKGSLFMISMSGGGQILRPICLDYLASPRGIAVSNDGKYIYVAEMMTNRILRLFQRPEGVYHCSVFYQLSGKVGPSAVVCDASGNIYVAHFDTAENSDEGCVYVISPEGTLLSTILTSAPEVTGLVIYNNVLFITESSSGSVFKADLQ